MNKPFIDGGYPSFLLSKILYFYVVWWCVLRYNIGRGDLVCSYMY